MNCPSCGHDNRDDAEFCLKCGSRLAVTCPSCQLELPPEAEFCDKCGASLTAATSPAHTPAPTPQPVPTVPASFADGRYQVQRFLGEGGKKWVYLARDTKLDSDVAIGLIKTEGLDADGLTRVRREAQAMGRLRDHPHIVTVLDIGDEDGQPYIVLEFMEGGSLEELLQQAADHRLPLDDALRIAGQVCQALEHAHGKGIIHRDLKPGNVWLTKDGTPKLGDFGLARLLDRSRLTREGLMVGTTLYMPPEQAVGGEVTPRSDLYALGCLLYEVVTGRPPFLGDDSVAIISQHINTAPVAPTWHNAEVPQALEILILALLSKAPEERPESAAAVGEELRRISERPAEEMTAPPSPTTELQGMAWGQFVGRREEMDQLKAALENTFSGHGSLIMLVGEPGIGKTRLAEEFGVYASLRGAQVLTGRSYDGEVSLPYRPFVEALRQYMRGRPDAELRGELAGGAPEVANLVSEIRQRFPDIPEAPPLEPEAERLRLFESVTSFVRSAAAANPLILFLDDLHWADKPSLLMLRYLARAIAGDRVLILGAYRDVDLDRTHPLAEVIASLRQERLYQRVLLRGLPEEDVVALLTTVEASEGAAVGRDALATALYRETEGNPFFIREVLSHLVEEGLLYREGGRWTAKVTTVSELGIPEGVREVVGRRLSRLGESCNRMLTVASTMTGGFSWEELRAITGESESALLDVLDEALAAQLIHERKGDQAGSYDFTHALVRQTLYEELSSPRRVLLHRQIGQALEKLYAANLEPHLAQLAHHFYQAAPGGDVDKALDYTTRAAKRATAHFAWEDAVAHYQRALQVTDLLPTVNERLRVDLLLALAGARLAEGGDESHRQESALRGADIARQIGDHERFARSVLAFAGPHREDGVLDRQLVALLEEGLSLIGAEDSELRAKLLVRLSAALFFAGERERRQALTNEALTIARRLADREALIYVFRLAVWVWDPGNAEEQVANGREMLVLAGEAGDKAMTMAAHAILVGPLLEQGDRDGPDAAIDAYIELQREMRRLGWGMTWRTMQADLDGRLADAEQLLGEGYGELQKLNPENAVACFSIQLSYLRRQQGRWLELEDAMQTLADERPAIAGYRAALSLMLAEAGRLDDARGPFETLASADFAGIPFDRNWTTTMSLLAAACTALDDVQRAGTLYEMLQPYEHLSVVTTISCIAIAYGGSLHRSLGGLAMTMSRWADAERHYKAAIAADLRMRATGWVARAKFEYARMLIARDAPDDRERALDLLNEALDTAQELGMKSLVESSLALKMEVQRLLPSAGLVTSIDAVASAVQSEQPDLRPHAAPNGTVTLMFTDIEGSTALNERLGDQRWMELLKEHNALVRAELRSHDGYEVKTEGDGFMVAFSSARRALQCAIAIQHSFAQHSESAEEPLRVRIGLHTGEAIKEANDFYGRHVNLAARVADQAQGGEILVSSLLKELTDSAGDLAFGEAREVEMKGLSGTQTVFSVAW